MHIFKILWSSIAPGPSKTSCLYSVGKNHHLRHDLSQLLCWTTVENLKIITKISCLFQQ